MKFAELTQLALLGTERQPPPSALPGAPLGNLLAQLDTSAREHALLSAAAAAALHQRAGSLPARDLQPVPATCAAEEFPRVNARCAGHLSAMLGGDMSGLLPEWLAVAAQTRQIATPELLPQLLALGREKPELRDAILPVLGARGRWLAELNPDWSWVQGAAEDEDVWHTGEPAGRRLFLQHLRVTSPARARELVASTWKEEAPDDRAAFIQRLGAIPDSTPMVPLARDLAREQKRLRLPPEAGQRVLDLDLRKPNDLDRSRLLHRLNLLSVPWGKAERGSRRQQGTFHELWRVQWQPEFAVALIEAGVWGNTLPGAAAARVRCDTDAAPDLPALTALLGATLLADLPDAAAHLMARLQAVAAVASDVAHLMGALPPLANILRYGNVRQTDAAMVGQIVDGLVARICIGLPGACGSLNDEAAAEMFAHLVATHGALSLLQTAAQLEAWNHALREIADAPNLHGLIAGRACRLLLDGRQMDASEAARRFSLAFSSANAPAQPARWAEGLLRDSGMLLVHDDTLWKVIDDWVTGLSPGHFTAVLPLLRRTFATFQPAERRQLGERVARGASRPVALAAASDDFDQERANKALPLVAQLLGLKIEGQP